MSGTTTTPAPQRESLLTPQTVIALIAMTIVAGTVAAVLWIGDPQTKSQTVGGVLSMGALVAGYYFGSSSGSQKKDAMLLQAPTPTVTTTPGAPTP